MSTTLPEIKSNATTSPMAAGINAFPEIGDGASLTAPMTPARRAWVENITIISRHKSLIITVTAIVTIATGIYAFMFMPNYYSASAVIPPRPA